MTFGVSLVRLLDDHRSVWWVFVLAIAVRLALLMFLHDSYYTSGMAQGELARNLAEGRGFVVNIPFSASISEAQWEEGRLIDIRESVERFPPADHSEDFRPFIAYMMPGQGILLAGTYLLTGIYSYLPLQIVQALVDALSVFMLVSIGSMVLSRRAGFLAAFLFALYIPEARLAITATRDAWMPVMYTLIAYAAVRAWKKDRLWDHVLLGLTVVCTAYFRAEVLLLSVWVGIFLLLVGRKLRTVGPRVAVSIVPIILILLPWTVRNEQVFDRLIPTNTGLWMAMWQSFGEYPNDFGAVNNDRVTLKQMRDAGYMEAYDTPEYDALFRPKVMEVLTEHPVWVGWTVARRLARMPFQMHAWGLTVTDEIHGAGSPYPTGIVAADTYMEYVLQDPVRLLVHLFARGLNLLLFISVALWFWKNRTANWQAGLILFSVPLYNILVHAVIGTMARYILPTNPIHLLFLAALIATSVPRAAER